MLVFMSAEAVADGSYVWNSNIGMSFSWQEGDRVCAYTEDGSSRIVFKAQGEGSSTSFTGSGWTVAANKTYYGYFPYNPTYVAYGYPMTALPISYLGQKQNGNANAEHLKAFDYMTCQTTTTESTCQFDFAHLSTLIRLNLQLPTSATVTSVEITSETGTPFATSATMNVTNNIITPTTSAASVSLTLSETKISTDEHLVAYIMVAPTDLSETRLVLTVTTDSGSFSYLVEGKKLEQRLCYEISDTNESVCLSKSKTTAIDYPIGNATLFAKAGQQLDAIPLTTTTVNELIRQLLNQPDGRKMDVNNDKTFNIADVAEFISILDSVCK